MLRHTALVRVQALVIAQGLTARLQGLTARLAASSLLLALNGLTQRLRHRLKVNLKHNTHL